MSNITTPFSEEMSSFMYEEDDTTLLHVVVASLETYVHSSDIFPIMPTVQKSRKKRKIAATSTISKDFEVASSDDEDHIAEIIAIKDRAVADVDKDQILENYD